MSDYEDVDFSSFIPPPPFDDSGGMSWADLLWLAAIFLWLAFILVLAVLGLVLSLYMAIK